MGVDRKSLRALRDAEWASVDDLREFVEGVLPLAKRDVEKMLEVLLDPKIERVGPRHKNRCAVFKTAVTRSAQTAFFSPLAQAIVPGDPMLRAVIVELLPRMNDTGRHDDLCVALGDKDPKARAAAAQALGEVGGPTALKSLTELARSPGFMGRREALDVMIPKARHRALELIVAVAERGTTPERVYALGFLGDPELMSGALEGAIEAALALVESPERRVSEAALRAFAALAEGDRFLDAIAGRVLEPDVSPTIVEAIGHVRSPRAVQMLKARLRIGPPSLQLAAVRALGRIATDEVVGPLVEALHLPDGPARRAASEALFALGSRDDIDLARLLVTLLKSPHAHVRAAASQIASTVKRATEDLVRQLLATLRDESWWVRERVLDALVEMRLPSLTRSLVEYLSDENPVIRRYAIYGLLRMGDRAALGAILTTAVSDDDWWVREQAIQATAELGDLRAVEYLLAIVEHRPDLRVASLEALEGLGAEDELLKLAELASDDDPAVRLSIVTALGRIDRGREAAFYVQACRDDPEPVVARAARELLDRWDVGGEDEGATVGLLERMLVAAARREADDLLLAPNRPPYVKDQGQVSPISKGLLSAEEMQKMIFPLLTPQQRDRLAAGADIDMSYEVPGFGIRFRINVFRERNGLAAVFRRIQTEVPHLDALGLPEVVRGFADYPNGLVLVGGPTGSGKSTTLAALIGYINQHSGKHIVTIEDPIEMVHPQSASLINQREVGTHAPSFAHALRAVLRQDPDVLLVGELRDQETIEFAVNAAETGHLVFATVHTTSAALSVDRMIHAMPAARQPLIRSMLAESLRAVVCQQLLRRSDRPGKRVLACEVMINNHAVSNLIRKDKSFQIPSVILTHADEGMQLMDDHLQKLVASKVISPEDGLLKALDKHAFRAFVDALEAGDPSAATIRATASVPPPSIPPPNLSGPGAGSVSAMPRSADHPKSGVR